jgi:hypothetical protein
MASEGSRVEAFFESASRFCWATALFGVKQLGGILSPGDADHAAAALDSVTRAAEGQLDESLGRAFRAGDRLQRGLWDLAYGLLTPDAFTSRGMTRLSLNVLQQSAGVLGQLVPAGEGRAALQEFRSKLQVFDLFENVDTLLRLPRGAGLPLSEMVGRASRLDPFLAVWATEGVGHYYAEAAWESGGVARGLLKGAATRGVPAKSMAALHAGMGLSLANRLLAAVGRQCRGCPPHSDHRSALRRFVALCRDNADEGYVGATYEALGMVARNLYPHLVPYIDRLLSEAGGDLADYFWHGVGRAIYFAPTNYLPLASATRRAAEMALREPPHQLGRQNALSGVAWALLLVNLRHPEVIENFLRQCTDAAPDSDAVANGMSSAAVIWRDSTEGDTYLDALCLHRPDPSYPALTERWLRLVATPCRRALDEYYGALKRRGRVGEVFRYQSLPALAGDLTRAAREEGAAGRAGGRDCAGGV